MLRTWTTTAGIVLSTALVSAAQPQLTGRVVEVRDGDTVVVAGPAGHLEVRLEGIDCPELGQPYSQVARKRTVALALFRDVEAKGSEMDDYGRLVARLMVDGQDVNLTLVREGLAWHYLRYSSDPALAAAERVARTAHVGLWQDAHPLAPWEWRQARRPTATLPAGSASLPLHGNVSSHLYHRPGCPQYNCHHCTRVFQSEQAASAAGYRPAGCCSTRLR